MKDYSEENSMVLPMADDELREEEIDEDARFEEQREEAIADRERFAKSVTDDLVKTLPTLLQEQA